MLKVIGIGGQKLNGKTTIANYLIGQLAMSGDFYRKRAYADEVKNIFCNTFGVNRDFIEDWKPRDEIPPGFSVTVRRALQIIGDEFRKIKGNVWIEYLFQGENYPDMVIDDCRYINELRRVREASGCNVLVYRPGFLNDDPNGSEAQIRPIVVWFVEQGVEGVVTPVSGMPEGADLIDLFIINNGSMEDLRNKTEKMVLPFVRSRYANNQDQSN